MKYLFFSLLTLSFIQGQTFTGTPSPTWVKYSIVKGTAGWKVNSDAAITAASASSQTLTLFHLPANSYVAGYRITTVTACSGVNVLTAKLGTATTPNAFVNAPYDLKTAVSTTNFTTGHPATLGGDTLAANDVIVTITGVGSNLTQVVNGCAFDVHILWSVLP